MSKKRQGRNFKQERLRIYDDKRKDPYREKQKPPEPTVCTECSALFTNGRWTWDEVSTEEVNEAVCPACQRIAEDYPAGIIEISGDFFYDHYREIMNLVRNTGKMEMNEHPLERIMEVNKEDNKIIVTTTGMHLARRIGEALENSYQGELDYNYDAESFIRVDWQR